MSEKDSTAVIVIPLHPDPATLGVRPVRYDGATGWASDSDGDLLIKRDGATFAIWARGTWQRAETVYNAGEEGQS